MAENIAKLEWHNERRKIKDLLPFEFNPRTLSDADAAHLTTSLEKFNLVEIPAIDTDNRICAGHQRIGIMIRLGRGGEEIDVRVPNRKLTEEEFKEYNIRSNKNQGDFDFDILANHYEQEQLLEWGFTEAELEVNLGDHTSDTGSSNSEKQQVVCPECGHHFEVFTIKKTQS